MDVSPNTMRSRFLRHFRSQKRGHMFIDVRLAEKATGLVLQSMDTHLQSNPSIGISLQCLWRKNSWQTFLKKVKTFNIYFASYL
jgi:hypothetical protein